MKAFYSSVLVLSLLLLPGVLIGEGEKPRTPQEACDYYAKLVKETARSTGLDDGIVERKVFNDGPIRSRKCALLAPYWLTPAGFNFTVIVPLDGKVDEYWQQIATESAETMEKRNVKLRQEGYEVSWTIDVHGSNYVERGRAVNETEQNYIQLDCVCRRIEFGAACWSSDGDPANRDSADELKSLHLDEEPFLPPQEWIDLFNSLD